MSSLKVTLPEDLKQRMWREAYSRAAEYGDRPTASSVVIEALEYWLSVPQRCPECRKPDWRAQS